MRANGAFTVKTFNPTSLVPEPAIETALPVGVVLMEKHFEGDIVGRSATVFTAAFDQATGVGTYVAMESFEGAVDGREGAFNFVHSASSGSGQLAGLSGTGGLAIDPAGTHRIWLDYEIGG
jgi:hypothetical protein